MPPAKKAAPKAAPAAKTPKSRHLRKQSNVRLSDAARTVLADAVVWLGVSQSAVMELALRELANRYGINVKAASRPQSDSLLTESSTIAPRGQGR